MSADVEEKPEGFGDETNNIWHDFHRDEMELSWLYRSICVFLQFFLNVGV